MSQASELTTKIIGHVYKTGGFAFRASSTGIYDKNIGGWRTAPKKGVSDIIALFKGRFIAIEVKIGKDRLSIEQKGFLKNIEHYGGLAFIAKDFDSFKGFWDNMTMLV